MSRELRLGPPHLFPKLNQLHADSCSGIRNTSQGTCYPITGADTNPDRNHNRPMLRDWYLKEWMGLRGKRQAHMISELNWTRRKASEVYNGDQPYKRETVNELADWLQLQPYELLMPPAEALRLRQLRDTAAAIVANQPLAAEEGRAFRHDPQLPPAPKRKAS